VGAGAYERLRQERGCEQVGIAKVVHTLFRHVDDVLSAVGLEISGSQWLKDERFSQLCREVVGVGADERPWDADSGGFRCTILNDLVLSGE
jgi:hypothetical protein